ncbi:DUF6138 family protein [Burkholderia ubonensis]|uniref:DUF6138 family protein n=2 Tax=Burkholderia ubonensis TaxID=101571 RepID=UPI00228713BE|nr:DUF6138 family protein [Burkholderia ubonensis]
MAAGEGGDPATSASLVGVRSPAKHCLPVKGLPKKGVHQLFANATGYPELRPFIAQYARLAMREHEWYTNIDEADPAMPGTFAVFDGGGCVPDHAWKAVVHAIWGGWEHASRDVRRRGAPDELKALYEAVPGLIARAGSPGITLIKKPYHGEKFRILLNGIWLDIVARLHRPHRRGRHTGTRAGARS